MRTSFWSLILSMSAFLPTGAAAQESVLVMDIATEEAYAAQAALVTERLRAEIATVPGWEVSPTRTTLDAARTAHGCREQFTDPECLADIARQAGVGHIVFGRIRPRDMARASEFTIELQRYELASGRYGGSTFRSIRVEGDGPQAELTARLQTILGEDDLAILPGGPRPAVPTAETQPPPQGGPSTREVMAWLGVGSLVLAGGSFVGAVATWAGLAGMNGDPEFQAYRGRVPAGLDLCAEAAAGNGWARNQVTAETAAAQAARTRSICSDAGPLEAAQAALLIGSALFAGVGIALLVIDPGPGQQPVTVTPAIGPGHAGLSLSLGF